MTRSLVCSVVLLLLLLWRIPQALTANRVQTDADQILRRLTQCNVDFPVPGGQACYRINVESDPNSRTFFSCDIEEIEIESNEIPLLGAGSQTIITSPGFDAQEEYPNDYLCVYTFPVCLNNNNLQQIMWMNDQFELECAQNFFFLNNICPDTVELVTPADRDTLIAGGAIINDPFEEKVLCGIQNTFMTQMSGPPLRVAFRSNNQGSAPGFRMGLQCAEAGPLPSGCTIIPPMSTPGQPGPLPPIAFSDRVEVPPLATISYWDNVLRIVQGTRELLIINGIQRLFFWTGFNGTRVFAESAQVPEEEIFGGGTLIIVNGCGYYATFRIPTRFVPNDAESEILRIVFSASASFFISPSASVPSTPSGKRKRRQMTAGATDPLPLPDPLPPAFSFEAVAKSCQFRNACNTFVRQAINDYLTQLETELGQDPCRFIQL